MSGVFSDADQWENTAGNAHRRGMFSAAASCCAAKQEISDRQENCPACFLLKRSQALFISPLMFCLFEQLFVLMLAHLLLAPFYNVPHTLTTFQVLSIKK